MIVYSFAAALVITLLFTTGVRSFSHSGRGSLASRSLGAAGFGACACLVVVGLYVMFTSK